MKKSSFFPPSIVALSVTAGPANEESKGERSEERKKTEEKTEKKEVNEVGKKKRGRAKIPRKESQPVSLGVFAEENESEARLPEARMTK